MTLDPIKGIGQKSENVSTQVHKNFVVLSQKHTIKNGIEIPMRNKESVEQRWKKMVANLLTLEQV